MKQLYGKGTDSDTQPATTRDSERQAGNTMGPERHKRQPVTIRDSERHAVTLTTPWDR